MISRTTRIQLFVFAVITLARHLLRRREVRPARPAVHRRDLHRLGRPPGVRRHLRRRRGHLPRCVRGPGRGPPAARRWRVRRPGDPARRRHDPRRRRSPWSRTVRRSASSTSTCSRRATPGPTCEDGSEIERDDTRIPSGRYRTARRHSTARQHRGQAATSARSSTSSARRSRAPVRDLAPIIDTSDSFIETANANFDVTKELITRQPTRPAAPSSTGESAIRSLRARPRPVHDHAGRDSDKDLRTRDRQRQRWPPATLRGLLDDNQVDARRS